MHLIESLGAAEAAHGERQVGGNAQHDRVVERGGLLVEGARRLLARGRVERGHNVEHLISENFQRYNNQGAGG